MIHLTLYKFSKYTNSTKQPPATAQKLELTGVFKENISVLNPVIEISMEYPDGYNYAYIAELKRYYFIRNVVCVTDTIYEFSLAVDVLATYKTAIGELTEYITRSSYDAEGNLLYNSGIMDSLYPIAAGAPTFISSSDVNPFSQFDVYGSFIVGVVSANGDMGVTYYCMDSNGLRDFNNYLFSNVNWLNVTESDLTEGLQKALINPYNYVVSVQWCPIPSGSISGYSKPLKFGYWDTGRTGKAISVNASYSFSGSLAIPKHPAAATRGNYLNLAPYSQYNLRFYPFGFFAIDSEIVGNYNTLDWYVDLDIVSGDAALTLAVSGKSNPIRYAQAHVNVNLPTVGISTDFKSLSTGTITGALALAGVQGEFFKSLSDVSGLKDIPGALSALGNDLTNPKTYSNIISGATAMLSSAEYSGSQGCFSLFDSQSITLSGRFAPIAAENFAHSGRPLCEPRQIKNCKGFLKCADSDVSIPGATLTETQGIGALLVSGIFYE
ncbi:MAG: hypothetical protein KBS70_05770 [Bacteroidales bacterium]|nr:hypothetical protein [Candidatus Colicola equi]